jgi:ribosomal protein L32
VDCRCTADSDPVHTKVYKGSGDEYELIMPGTVICENCGQRKKSERHHCTPSAVEKQERIEEQFGNLPSDLASPSDSE